ncbi:hypothetical protein ACNKHU_24195 [Shigella flexneri]
MVVDRPGFFVNPCAVPVFAGFSQLLRDGADFRKIDKVMGKTVWLADGSGISAGCRGH